MSEGAIVLFDGVCNFCSGAVRFIIARDPRARFRFAPLQSEVGRELLVRGGLAADALDTMVVVEDGRYWTNSDAALRIAAQLSGAWPLLAALRYVPRALRDRVYRWIVDHRYGWFGKSETCAVPTPELRGRFLEQR